MTTEPDFETLERERDEEAATAFEEIANEMRRLRHGGAVRPHPGPCEVALLDSTAGGRSIARECGDTDSWGGTALCPPCDREAEAAYPYGWRHYPGDPCDHGVYVGGSGRDLMCQRCEDGID